MYAVVIFALALLSPLPFISPFASADAAEELFFGEYTIPKNSISLVQTTAATDGGVTLTASQFTSGTILIKATVNGTPSFSLVAESDEIPFNFPNNIFTLTGTYKNNSAITNVNSTSWFAHEHVDISYIDNDTVNGPDLVDLVQFIPPSDRQYNLGATLGDSISNLGDIDGDGISDIGIGATGEGDEIHKYIDASNATAYEFTRRDRGAFYIMLMNDDGTIKSSIKFDHTTPNMPSLINEPRTVFDVSLGSAIASLGDVYNDGTTVLAVGASKKSYGINTLVGMVLILHLSSDGTRILDSFEILADAIYPKGISAKSGTFFGASLANIGDVDNNGVPDLAIGATGYPDATDLENPLPEGLGAVFIFHMGENATSILNVANITSLTNGLNLEINDRFGTSVELLETYDDGTIALAIGTPYQSIDPKNSLGYIYILNMTNNATTVSTLNIISDASPNLILNPRNHNINGKTGITPVDIGVFAFSLENMGDLNGDGVNDLLVGYPNLNSIGGSYILYMNSDNTVRHSVKFQIDRHENELGTARIIANETADVLDTFQKYFNYSTPPNMPEYLFQEHISPFTGTLRTTFFNLGTAVVNFGDVHNDGYDDIGLTSIGLNSGTVVVLNRLGPTVNITVDPNYTNIDTIHYRPDATNYITVNGINLTKDLNISIKPYILNVTLQSPGTFIITFHRDINASSISADDFAINDVVHIGTVSVVGAVVTLQSSGIFAADAINKITIVDDVLDQTGNAAEIGHSSFTIAENNKITASRTSKNTITLNFNALFSTDNTDSNAFRVINATVNSWTSNGTVITISISGLTGTSESPIVVYDSSHSTNFTVDGILVNDGTTVTATDKTPPEYIDTVATGFNQLTIQFSEKLDDTLSLNANNFTIDPANAILSISIVNERIILQLNDSLFTLPNVIHSVSIADNLGNNVSQSNSTVARDGFGPVIISAYTTDINAIDIIYHEPFTQTTFEKSLITVDDLNIKNVVKINDTTLRVITEQFSSSYTPSSVIINTPLTDTLGYSNQLFDIFSNTKDRLGPSPIFMQKGLNEAGVRPDLYRRIIFDESLNNTPSITSITLYNLSGNLFNPSAFAYLVPTPDKKNSIIGSIATSDSLYINITGDIFDTRGNNAPLGTIVYEYDNEKPILNSARVFDANTITMTFDKLINYTTVSIQDFTINDSITVSDVLTRGDTIYLTTDTLTIGNAYFVNLVGSIADFANGTPNATNTTIVYETIFAEDLTITSTNANPSYAKSGDTLRINLTSDESLTSANVTILGVNVQPVSSDRNVDANTTVATDAPNGYATFAINVEIVSGHTRTFTQNDLLGSNVFVDTTPPNITLIGNANYTVFEDATNPSIPGAIVTDEDPNYSGNYTVTSNTTLDTTVLGSVYNYTYTADSDSAGNPGASVIRIVTIIDKLPINVTSLNIASSSGNNYANANKNITLTLVTDGTDLVNFTGTLLGREFTNITAGGSANFTVTVRANDTNENATFSINMTNSSGNQISISNADITDDSFVTIDTINPVITLVNGSTTVPQNVSTNSSFTDPGAIASDASYDDDIPITGTGNVNTTKTGIYTLSYKAPDDPAGNTGPTITRTLNVRDAPPIGITSFTFYSSNPRNESYAKTGNALQFVLAINYSISSYTAQILEETPTAALINGLQLYVTWNVPNSTIESYATFVITVTNNDGTSLTITEDDLSNKIFVDTVSPRIELVGSEYHTLVQNSTDFVPSVIVTDGDPNYSGNYTITSNATVNTTVLGSVYNYTYTADDDSVGNPGNSVSQIITIIDPKPITITSLTIASSSGNNYANANKTITLTLVTDGTDLGNFTGTLLGREFTNITAGGSANFTVTVRADDTNENATFSITMTNSSGNQFRISNTDITDNSFVIIDTINPVITLVNGSTTVLQGETYQDPGTTISDENNASYAGPVSASSINTTILGSQNITYTGTADAAGNEPDSINRTITVLAKPLGLNSLTIISDNNVNTSFAKDGDVITVTLVVNGTIGNVTGIIANNSFTYTVNGNNASATVTVNGTFVDTANVTFSINASNEDNLTFRTFTNANLTGSNIAIDTTAPSITLNGANNTIVFTNFAYTDKNATATDVSYATGSVQVSGTDTVNTATAGNYTITYTAPDDPAGNPGNTISRTVRVQDASPLEIVSIFNDSPVTALLRGTDFISDVNNVRYTSVNSFKIDNISYALLLDREFGNIIIINITNPASPILVYENNSFTNGSDGFTAYDASIFTVNDATYAIAVTKDKNDVWILNISNPESPFVILTIKNGPVYPILDNLQGVTTVTIDASVYALITDRAGDSVQIIDVTNPASPKPVSLITDGIDGYEELDGALGITTIKIKSSIYALVASYNDDGVQIIDITDPYNPASVSNITDGKGGYDELNGAFRITAVTIGLSTFALVASIDDDGVQIINITDPYNPQPASSITDGVGGFNNTNDAYHITTTTIGASVFALVISVADNSVNVIDITDPYNPKLTSVIVDNDDGYTTLSSARETSVITIDDSTYILVTAYNEGIQIIKLGSSSIGITGNNSNPKYAKAGDTLVLGFIINDTITSHTSQFLELENPNVIINDTKYSATITVPSTPRESYATFAIQVVSDDSATYVTENDVPLASNVFIDTIKPGILLIGSENYNILQNAPVSSIPNVTVTDGDPNYAGTFSVTTNGTLNTSVIGSIVLYTYTANPDGAGNAGNSTSRLVTVTDIEPITINSLNIASSSGNNYANANKTITLTLVTDGTDLGNFTGTLLGRQITTSESTGGTATFTTTVQPSDVNENATFSITMTNSSGNQISISNADITDDSFVTIDTIKPVIVLTGGAVSVLQGDAYQEPGTTISDSGNAAYAGLVSASSIDITILGSQNITYTGTADAAGNEPDSINRTITVLAKPLGLNSLTIISDNNVNTSFAKDGDVITVTLVANGTIGNVTGIIANNSVTYTVNGNNASATVTVNGTFVDTANVTFSINASNEDNLTFRTFTNANLTGSNIAIDTTAPSITLNGANNTIVFTNFAYTDKNATATDVSYATGSVQVSGTDTVNTATAGNYTITYTAPDDPAGNPGNTISRTVRVQDASPLEIVSIFNDSPVTALLRGTDFISDVNNVRYTSVNSFKIDNMSYALLLDREFGNIIIINITNPASPILVYENNSFTNGSDGFTAYDASIFTVNDTTYAIAVTTDKNDVWILNISNPESPFVILTIKNGPVYPKLDRLEGVTTVTIDASVYALITDRAGDSVQIIDVTNPASPKPVSLITDGIGGYEELDGALGITTIKIKSSIYALVASYNDDGVQIIDITDPYNPASVSNITDGKGGYDELNGAFRITAVTIGLSTFALVASIDDDGVQIINITDPYNPQPASSITDGVGGFNNTNDAYHITTTTIGASVFALVISVADNSVNVIDITDPYNPKLTSVIVDNDDGYTTLSSARETSVITIDDSTYILVTAYNEGIQIIKLGSSSIGITGNNSNPKYAKAGDTLVLGFIINDTITSHTSQFLELENPNVIINDTKYSATITVPSTPRESYATFAIQVVSDDSATYVTENDVPLASNVFIDTIKPGILLIGSENYNILQNAPVSSIPNVTVTDGDPNYAGTFSVTTNGTLNTSVIGSIVLYTYTANPDGAGNAGNSTSRLVTVTDIEPITINSLNIASSSGNNYANANKTITLTLVTDGTDLGNFTGTLLGREFTNITAGGSTNFTVTVRANDTNENATFSITMTNSSGNQISISNADIEDGSYVTIDTINPEISLIGTENIILIRGTNFTDSGAIASDTSYDENIIVYSTDTVNTNTIGTYTLNYTAPADNASNPGNTISRTVHVQDASPLEIVSIFNDSPVAALVRSSDNYSLLVNDPDARYNSVDTFKINNVPYALFLTQESTDILILNITNPASPKVAYENNSFIYTGTTGYIAHDVSIFTVNDDTYAIAVNEIKQFWILNISNPESPFVILDIVGGPDGSDDYPTFVRLNGVTIVTINASVYALITDRTGDSVQIVDVTNPVSPKPVSLITDNVGGYEELEGAAGITTIKIGSSIYALVASFNDDGVQIIDITDPYNPTPVSNITDGKGGYELDGALRITTITIGLSTFALVVAQLDHSVQIIDITDPYNPKLASSITDGVGGYDKLRGVYHITTTTIGASVYAIVASESDDAINVIDITDPYNPKLASAIVDNTIGYPALDSPREISVITIDNSTYISVISYEEGIQIIKLDSSSIGITGNNSNPQYAKAGDTLVLGFTINDTIASHTSQFLELENPNVIIDDTKYSATITVPSTPRESYATFAIQVANNDGATLNVTENDVPLASNVFIDTIKPRILLTGPQDYVILQNDSVSSIPNVTVTDGDPNYDGTFSVTTNGTLNTSVIGSTVLYTYTANPDGAGNVGDSINRTVTVAVFEPITITSLNIASSSGTNYANAGKNITLTLVTDGMDLGNFTVTLLGRQITTSGSTDGTATFTTTVQPGDDTENVTFSISATNSTGYRITGIKNDAITDGSYVTVDTVAPQITLNGDNNTIVMLGETFTDPGATATDASYASSILVNGIGTVTDTVGNHTLSYTAPIDPAGNTGPTITRTVLVKYFPKPEIVKLEIQIPSSEPYRKAGQVFDIVIAVNDVIKGSDEDDTATVFGMSKIVEYSNNKTGRIVNLVPSSPNLEQNITFEITVFNLDGVSITVTESDLTGPNVFVDNVAPRITLPSAVNVISINDPIPEIIAIATDGDPDYNGMVLEPVGSVDNTVSGIYPITYTASADNAGNLGSSATIIIAVNDESGTLILNSSVLDYGSQSFSTGDVIEFKVLNTTYPNNMITLFAPILKLDVSDITSNNGNSYTKTYPHHINLNVSSKITAQIEKNTNLIFTTNDSNPENFTVRYIVDEYYDDVIRFGLENVSYVLQNNAIEITFSDVSSSFNTYIRQNTSDSYKLITPYGSIINNGTHAWNLINVNNSGALYTYNDTTRTGTVWTSHLTDFKGNSSYSSSDDDDSDGNAPTLGKASSGAQLVTNGFEYNNLAVNVGRYHTEFPLIGTNVGDINTIKIKIYDSVGPTGIKRVELALGVPDVGLYHEAEAFIEIWMQRDSIAVQEIIIEDKLNLLEDSDVSSTVSQISCTGDVQQCLLVELKYSYREPPVYNTVSIKPVDWDNNAHQFYFNDGIHVDGDSINLPKEIDISASHAANTMHATGALHLIQIDRAEHLWVDQYGYQWMIMGNTVRQITVPEYLVPNDNTFGTLHGPDRNHPEFASTIYAEQLKAQETLAEILGHATIIKPLPESGGTIYFDATGTDSRSGDSFKLVLELETARMQQLSNLLYDDTS